MVQPCKDKVWGHTTYHFVVPGFKLVYFVSNQRLPQKQSQFVLQQDGSLIFQVRSVLELPTVSGFMKKFESEGRSARDSDWSMPTSPNTADRKSTRLNSSH